MSGFHAGSVVAAAVAVATAVAALVLLPRHVGAPAGTEVDAAAPAGAATDVGHELEPASLD
jgi:hypothetical protein